MNECDDEVSWKIGDACLNSGSSACKSLSFASKIKNEDGSTYADVMVVLLCTKDLGIIQCVAVWDVL